MCILNIGIDSVVSEMFLCLTCALQGIRDLYIL